MTHHTVSPSHEPLLVDVWSDVACPWCYVGKRRLEAALRSLDNVGPIEVRFRSFELDPSAPRAFDPSLSYVERLARKYSVPTTQAEQMIERMVRTGKEEGIDFDFSIARAGNTFDAHRVLHFAREEGRQDAMKERMLRAYFTEGALLSDPETLVRLGVEVGLSEEPLRAVAFTDSHAADVKQDEREAQELGISGVPFFVIGRYGISGAQSPALLQQVFERVFQEAKSPVPPSSESTQACTPSGCS